MVILQSSQQRRNKRWQIVDFLENVYLFVNNLLTSVSTSDGHRGTVEQTVWSVERNLNRHPSESLPPFFESLSL